MFKQTLFTISLLLIIPQLWAETLTPKEDIGAQLIKSNCVGCHITIDEGLSRISYQRKTAEGWQMTIHRMQQLHGLQLNNGDTGFTGNTQHEIVKYLTDNQGLAPTESQEFRYLLEQDLNSPKGTEDAKLEVMCGRCHSIGRVGLQRRNEKEWRYLVDFHVGQFPSVEYSLYGRDRNWLKIAREEVAPKLAKIYPLHSAEWDNWQASIKPALNGRWVLSGHMPGKGYFSAIMRVEADKKDYYSLTIEGSYSNGEIIIGTGSAIVYTGYDWRGTINFGDIKLRQALAASADGETLTGRFYQKGQDLVGMKVTALKDSSATQLLGITPNHIQKGKTTTVTITGRGLQQALNFSSGIVLDEIISQESNKIIARISAPKDGKSGYASIMVGKAKLDNQLAIYSQVNSLEIVPAYGVARIGSNGGSTPKVNTIFRAIGIDHGVDGIANTADDLNLGYIEQVKWHVVPRDQVAENDEDVKFAGQMDATTGIFSPAGAGLNPERKRSTNNAGNLNVVASLTQGDTVINGTGRLLVTVQRWNNPPLK